MRDEELLEPALEACGVVVVVMLVVIVTVVPMAVIPVAVVRILTVVMAAVVLFRMNMVAHIPASGRAWGAIPWRGAFPSACSAWWMASATSCQAWPSSSR